MISGISSFEIIRAVIPGPNILLWIATFVADAAIFNRMKTFETLFNVFNTFFIKGNPVFSNGTKILCRNSVSCPILCKCVFDIFKLAEELFAKPLRSF